MLKCKGGRGTSKIQHRVYRVSAHHATLPLPQAQVALQQHKPDNIRRLPMMVGHGARVAAGAHLGSTGGAESRTEGPSPPVLGR